MPEIFDAIALDSERVRVSRDGYLLADARVARTGIQVYLGRELGRPDLADVRVFRPEDEVFAEDAMASFAHRPVTSDHPPELVTSANWKRFARGQTGGEIARDGECIRIPLMVADADAIADVQAGKRELSAGYTCDIDWTSGEAPDGQPYDAVMRKLRGNHVAIVARGRAGPSCRIGDGTPDNQGKPMKSIIADGVTVEVPDEAASAFEKLQAQLRDATTATDARDGEIAALRASSAAAITAKDSELAELRSRVPDAAALDAAIAARGAVIEAARRIVGDSFDPAGKTDAAIRRAAVAAKLGDAKLEGRSDDYVAAAFDTLTALPAAADPVRDAIRSGAAASVKDGVSAYDAYRSRLANDWKSNMKEEAV